MSFEIHYLPHGANLDLTQHASAGDDDRRLMAVIGGGRGCMLRVAGPAAAMWLPLRGHLQLDTSSAESVVAPGEMWVTEAAPRIRAVGRGNALWIAFIGSAAAWRRVLGRASGLLPEAPLVPARHRADRALRRLAVAFMRASDQGSKDARADALVEALAALQAGFAAAIVRCPGRTLAQRRQVFVRLQRVRNHLATNCHLPLDNDALASMANYSPWHFIRVFRAAYEETPHACLVQMRLQRARRLLRASPLAIAEIALASGFENRCSFSRLFRERFGVTAGSVRRGAIASHPWAAAR